MQSVAVDPATAGIVAGIAIANFGAIVAAYVGLRERLKAVEVQLIIAQKDIDAIAYHIGTPRAIAERKTKNA